MKPDYQDILSKIDTPPLWWDSRGVPRYNKFTPDQLTISCAHFAALVTIHCQHCHITFDVEIATSAGRLKNLDDFVQSLDYGDPPFHQCIGDTMLPEFDQIKELWEYLKSRTTYDWHQHVLYSDRGDI